MIPENYKNNEETAKKMTQDGYNQPTKCINCLQMLQVIKRLQLENQNLTYQIGFKDIALKKREEMICILSKDNNIAKEHLRQMEISAIVRNSTETNEVLKINNKSCTERGSSMKLRQSSLPKLKQQYQLQNQIKIPITSQYNMRSTKEIEGRKQITFQELLKPQSLMTIKGSLVFQEDEGEQLQQVSNIILPKNKSNTLILKDINNHQINDSELQRQSSQNEFSLEKQQTLNRSLSKGQFPSQKRASSPFKLQIRSTKNFDLFENQIYKSLDQLKASKYSKERKFLEDQVRSVEYFAENIVRESFQIRSQVAEDVRHLLKDYVKVLDQSITLKKLVTSNSRINRCFRAKDSINAIAEEIMQNVECDHVVFYIKDQYSQQLWTIDKNNQDQMIKIDTNKGILMHTLNSEKILRVEDVESDPRFSKENDACIHSNIKNMLCIPFKDNSNIIRGLIQIINLKKSDVQVSVDEILRLLVENIGQQIVSVLEFEQSVNNNHRVMKLLTDERELIQKAQELLTSVFLTPIAVVYLIKEGNICINRQEKYPLNSGVIGEALTQMKIIETLEHHSHPNANFNIDIDTVLPTVSVPVLNKNRQVIGAFQIVQDAIIRSNVIPREQIYYIECLQFFADLLAFNIERCQNTTHNYLSSP